MQKLEHECVSVFNNGMFQVVDPGPLHAPIHSMSISRNDKLQLILDCDVNPDGKSTTVELLPGTIRYATEKVTLTGFGQCHAELDGVIPLSLHHSFGGPMAQPMKERARIHRAKVTIADMASATYTIDWVENLPSSPFLWPDGISRETVTSTSWDIGRNDQTIAIKGLGKTRTQSNNAAALVVDGSALFVCALKPKDIEGSVHPGCIIYHGVPDDHFRAKIQTCLSFALGTYLINLGHSFYDAQWNMVTTVARSGTSPGHRIYDQNGLPFAPLGVKYKNELDRDILNSMVSAIAAKYDMLDLENLSWAYWHARVAPLHSAPAQFGGVIEALQRAYVNANPDRATDTILADSEWRKLKSSFKALISQADIREDARDALKAKLSFVNKLDQRDLLKNILDTLGLTLGEDENRAWALRNKAAHGEPVGRGEELQAIRQVTLLKGLFHRMLLAMTDAATRYVDYATPGHPHRLLNMPPADLLAE